MSELADDRLLPCPFCGGKATMDDSQEVAIGFEIMCRSKRCAVMPGVFNSSRKRAIAAWNRRAAASTSTEGAGVIEALRTLTSAVENMRVPQNIAEAAMQVELTIGPALRSAQDVLRALTPPAPKVTTDEAEERG